MSCKVLPAWITVFVCAIKIIQQSFQTVWSCWVIKKLSEHLSGASILKIVFLKITWMLNKVFFFNCNLLCSSVSIWKWNHYIKPRETISLLQYQFIWAHKRPYVKFIKSPCIWTCPMGHSKTHGGTFWSRVTFSGKTWHQDALWEEDKMAEAVWCFGHCFAGKLWVLLLWYI